MKRENWREEFQAGAAACTEARKSLATFSTILKSRGTRHSGGKKYRKGKLHFRHFLKVKIYISNLFCRNH